MKVIEQYDAARKLVQLNRKEAFEILEFLASELANEDQRQIQIVIEWDESQSA